MPERSESSKIDKWIHGRLVIDGDRGELIVSKMPVKGEEPEETVIGLTPEQAAAARRELFISEDEVYETAAKLGLKRAWKFTRTVGGTALGVAGVAIMNGANPVPALLGSVAIAAGSAVAGGASKSVKEVRKFEQEASKWKVFGGIIIEILRLIRHLISRKEKR